LLLFSGPHQRLNTPTMLRRLFATFTATAHPNACYE
jgi:hypothetical protein